MKTNVLATATNKLANSIAETQIAATLPQATLACIATIVKRDWKNIYFGAKPYLSAMFSLNTVNDTYGMDTGKSIVTYFLCNANTWRGPIARAVKAELNKRIKS